MDKEKFKNLWEDTINNAISNASSQNSKFKTIPVHPKEFFELWMKMPLFPRQYSMVNNVFTSDFRDWSVDKNEIMLMYGEGAGKDTLTTRSLCYCLYWILCLQNPQEYFHSGPGTPIVVLNCSFKEEHASGVFFRQFVTCLRNVKNPATGCNWFEEQGMDLRDGKDVQNRKVVFPNHIEATSESSVRYSAEGKNVLLAVFDEIAEFRYDKAKALYENLKNTSFSRFADHYKIVSISYPRDEYDYFCVTGRTPISTPKGKKLIRNIKKGDIVYSYNNEKKQINRSEVTNIFKRNVDKKDIRKIRFENNKCLICTNNHPILTDIGWISADKLVVGSKVKGVDHHYLTLLPKELDEIGKYKLGYLLGLTKGDGTINTTTPNRYYWSMFGKDKSHLIVAKRYITDIFTRPKISFNYYNNLYWLKINNKAIVKYIIQAFDLYEDDIDFAKGYIAGFYDAEGTASEYTISMSNTDSYTLKYIQKMLKILNIESSIIVHTKEKLNNNKSGWKFNKDCYNLVIKDNFDTSKKALFFLLTKPKLKRKYGKFQDIWKYTSRNMRKSKIKYTTPTNYQTVIAIDGIKNTTEIVPKMVYNLEVANDNNYFAANVLTHNCTIYNEVDNLSPEEKAKIYREKAASWEIRSAEGAHPFLVDKRIYRTQEDYQPLFRKDPEDAMRRFECKFPENTANRYFKKFELVLDKSINFERPSPIIWEDIGRREEIYLTEKELLEFKWQPWFKPNYSYRAYLIEQELLKDPNNETLQKQLLKEIERHEGAEYFVHIDLSRGVKDCAGVSLIHPFQLTPTSLGYYVDLAIQIRPDNNEINFDDIRKFVFRLSELGFEVNSCTFDGYQSIYLQQLLTQEGIHSEIISVDRSRKPYDTLKGLLYQGKIDMYNYLVILRELKELRIDEKGKVDHPKESPQRLKEEGDRRGSKDVSDAVAGAIYSAVLQGSDIGPGVVDSIDCGGDFLNGPLL